MGRLLIVSNRLPITVSKRSGILYYEHSVGGLATGMACLKHDNQVWIGWSGLASEKIHAKDDRNIRTQLEKQGCAPVGLSSADIRDYYYGFCNKTIWPLFHYFPYYCIYESKLWQRYERVNARFCEAVLDIAEPEDRIWIHDYQLMLLPQMLREHLPEVAIGFFLHIPFPSFELLRLLPWRTEILRGLLGADLIGFHEYDYVRHFLSSVHRICGVEHALGTLTVDNRLVRVDAFPMGIDFEKYAHARQNSTVQSRIDSLTRKMGSRKIIVSIDRLDYTKGILHRLEAFDWFLTCYPNYRQKVCLVLVAVPSRTRVESYADLRRQIEHLVGRINGTYGTIDWMPISYMYRSLPFEELVALYTVADVALITPLRDGMNLVAKEYIAAKVDSDSRGVLILSEMAGAACELSEALVVNPHDKERIVEAIVQALEMDPREQSHRNRQMQQRLSRYTVQRWAHDFMESFEQIKAQQKKLASRKINRSIRKQLVESYRQARRRLLLLDYDGTLQEFVSHPERAKPDAELLAILTRLCKDRKNEVVIISGRDKDTLTEWLGDLDLSLVAEHGNWIRKQGAQWRCVESMVVDWKTIVRPIMELYMDRTPGSFIEEKDFSLVWHCRRSEPDLARLRTYELRDAVVHLTENMNLGVFEGSKILEVKSITSNKGTAAEQWIRQEHWDLILAAGDDYTDEDIFAVLPETAFSIKIGQGGSRARYNADTVTVMRSILRILTGTVSETDVSDHG
ncbi:MAG: bifunctional alpha,alpha-trehalose-phosphate synthase (UDP-forming)/trehalose-phosphatase [Sedimentisphaerales bacterium]|nr:bifunctional alpha,alpha-trehalose-phosphate synthase (UDP-forming)/trehalose-phosphatase [Sedimentisphaerales bacterium]